MSGCVHEAMCMTTPHRLDDDSAWHPPESFFPPLVPQMCDAGVECFYGLGGTMFVGGGAAVLGYSPLVEAIGIVNEHADFWISVGCDAPCLRMTGWRCVLSRCDNPCALLGRAVTGHVRAS
jgi:hypothetical protein